MSSQMITASEVAEIMDCSERYGYSLIKQLNQELAEKGYITRRGRVSRKYFYERTGIEEVNPNALYTIPAAPANVPAAQRAD